MKMLTKIFSLVSLLMLTVATTLPYRFTVYNYSPYTVHVQGVVIGANDKFLDVDPNDVSGKQSGSTIANCWKKIIVTTNKPGSKPKTFTRGLGGQEISSCSDVEIQVNEDGSSQLI